MCGTCGCDEVTAAGTNETVTVEKDVLAKNDRIAEENRAWLASRSVFAVNLMSAPGSGKTTLLEATVRVLADDVFVGAVEGDQAGSLDADRLRAVGCRVVQINTGSGCHLDAGMLARALRELDPQRGSLVVVENVGNLVCPALFDLGERRRVVLASTTEGEDKPLKYPHMFRAADLVVLTKADLVPHLTFDVDHFARHLSRVNRSAELLVTSAVSGEGLDQWFSWLRSELGVPSREVSEPAASAELEAPSVPS
ncbi:hydrogenase nickel incorporation protein HypB [Saccharomonospora xinjiangensis]|uniref:hydrogenase nickel incorporation protein HypB n=1 Tax=Saccharomonospora xinjiangensis TaxID=75294 RepID=UPI001070632E|nr:hydrogenase nickel incorporation protein HypB [Saccharomonospora xinjiangensis]QBQ59242.1 Hydrogenase isoenzymes nickel incorporation protein HypB [Saccharomonospora xinjiangensis]